jgi:pilus assembly protein FimV
MLAKCSSRALALLLALPSAAFALGLGDIHLLSPLNAPLDAEIELVDVAPDEVNTVQAQIASRDTFARYGLDWPAYLGGVQVRTSRAGDGRQVIKLKSTEAISDPFITLLVDVSWSRGHLVREYTMLLDPPVYTPGGKNAVASAPVTAPATGAGTREGAIARGAEAPAASAPPPTAAATAAPATAAAEPPPATAAPVPAPAPSPSAAESAAASGASSGTAESESTHVVRRGETLSQIAADSAKTKVSVASWMLAIYEANPRAFDKNMNVLRSGAVLRMPEPGQVSAVSPSEANAEIRRQYAAWRGEAAGEAATTAPEQPGRLKLVTPSESASAGAAPGASAGEKAALQGRVRELEGQLAEQKRLLELKDADLARLQAQLAAKQAQPPATAPLPPPAAAPKVAEQPPAQPPAAQATPPAP